MREKFDKDTLDAIFSAPLEISARLRAPWGGIYAFPKRADIEDFLRDPEEWYARSEGVTKDDYLAWISSDGLPRCGAMLKNGQRCKNAVSGGIQRPLHDWLQADAGFCHVHGGESSREANLRRFGRSKR